METVFEYAIVTGTILVFLSICWLVLLAYMESVNWGLAVMFFMPVMLPWHMIRCRPQTKVPSLLLGLGAALIAFPPLYTRLVPVDLGPVVQMVDGEKHITLTGWNRKDYQGLADHPDVAVLQMANEDVTDGDVAHLKGFQNLRELDVSNARITDESIDTLLSLPKLERLRMSRTLITDPGFEMRLSKHPTLKQLWCEHTALNGASLEKWRRAGEGRRFVGGLMTTH